MSNFIKWITKIAILLLLLSIMAYNLAAPSPQPLPPPPRKLIKIEDVPYSWCDEDYPITADSIDTYQADEAYQADDMAALEDTSD